MINNIETKIADIVGKYLCHSHYAGGVRVFHFASNMAKENGEFALHVQCAWRIMKGNGIFVGESDFQEPVTNISGSDFEKWNPLTDGNVQEHRMTALIAECVKVSAIQFGDCGDVAIKLSGDYRIMIFPNGAKSEYWRFFSLTPDSEHFVIEGEE